MNIRRAMRLIYDVATTFDVQYVLGDDYRHANEESLFKMGASLGLSRQDVENGVSPVPDALAKAYPLFDLISQWNFSENFSGQYAPLRMLKAIFGEKYNGPDVPTEEEERQMCLESVQARCVQKIMRINELFPGSYPLDLPVLRFNMQTNQFLSFDQVYELAEQYDKVIARYSELFFAAMQDGLPEREAMELNLLSTFFQATDVVLPSKKITYGYIQQHRVLFQEEGFRQLGSYVRLRRELPVWKAREFYADREYVARYIENHENAKANIRKFLTSVGAYECSYTFITDMKEHELIQSMSDEELEAYDMDHLTDEFEELPYAMSKPILVDKEDGEISEEDRLIMEWGKSMVKSVYCGGVLSAQKRECYHRLQRMQKRLGLPIPICDDESVFCEEEGDCDE